MHQMSADQQRKEVEIVTLLKRYIQEFQQVLIAYRDGEQAYLTHNPNTHHKHQIDQDIRYVEDINNETLLFLEFLDNFERVTGDTYPNSECTYRAVYQTQLNDNLSPAHQVFQYYQKRVQLNSLNLSLSLVRAGQYYPRNTLDYITDTLRDMLHCLDKLITLISSGKQTMRETHTPCASFLGKKHFIEPSTRVGLQEKLDKLFDYKDSSIAEQLNAINANPALQP